LCGWFFSCSEEAVRQLVSEGALESLVALTSYRNSSDVVNAAASLLLSVASNAPGLRPYLGRAGAVQYFVHRLEELVTSDGTLPHKYHIVDALCQCCRDANNRIKVREQGGLSLLSDLLSNSKFANIHDRIISAFVCFLYDDASITVLLQNGLVPTLISHLYRAAGIAKKPDFLGLDSFHVCESSMDLTRMTDDYPEYLDDACMCHTTECAADSLTSFPLDTEMKQNSDELSHDSFVNISLRNESADTAVLETLSVMNTPDQLNADNQVDGESVVSEPNTMEVLSKPSRYSINSPTYKAVSAWRMEMAADEDEDSTSDRHSPRNIWEGAQLYGENFSAVSVHHGSVSPARSLGSCSDGLCSVRSWSSSLGGSSPQKSPRVSPAWSLDSSGSGIYSPFSNSSYGYPDAACSPLSFSDVEENQLLPSSRSVCSDNRLEACHVGSQSVQANCLADADTDSENTVNIPLTANDIDTEFDTDVSDLGQQNVNVVTSGVLLSHVDVIDHSNMSVAQNKSQSANEEESKEQCSDDEFDAESFQRKRQDERKFSRLLDIAKSMYASIETEPVLQSHQTKKRRRSSSGNTSPSVSARQKFQCPDSSANVENKSCTAETADANDLEALAGNSSVIDNTNSHGQVPQSLQIADDANSGEVDSDTETVASDDISASSDCRQHIIRVTERNILTLLSRISHSPETVAHVINVVTICGLLDYAALASNPLPAASRTLLRLSRSHHAFQQAVLCLFPVQAAWRMEPDWLSLPLSVNSCRHHSSKSGYLCASISCACQNDSSVDSVDHSASSDNSRSCKQEKNSTSEITESITSRRKHDHLCSSSLPTEVYNTSTKSVEVKHSQECVISKLCDEVIANLSTIAISGYGQGVVSHLLLRGNHSQRERCVISLCILCRFVFCVIS